MEPGRSTGSSPPFRLRDRVASHYPRAAGLALPGRRPPPIPPRRSPIRPTLGLGRQLVVGRRFHPGASGDRVGRSGGESGRAVVADWSRRWRRSADRRHALHRRSWSCLRSLQHTARCAHVSPGPAAGSAISRPLLNGPAAGRRAGETVTSRRRAGGAGAGGGSALEVRCEAAVHAPTWRGRRSPHPAPRRLRAANGFLFTDRLGSRRRQVLPYLTSSRGMRKGVNASPGLRLIEAVTYSPKRRLGISLRTSHRSSNPALVHR